MTNLLFTKGAEGLVYIPDEYLHEAGLWEL